MPHPRLQAECHLRGDTFSPALLQSIPDIHISRIREAGTLATKGRYKDQPLPFGDCTLSPPANEAIQDEISWLADFVLEHKATFLKAGATEIVFWIRWYGNQGNMELSALQLLKLAALEVPLAMDYIYVE